MFSLSLLRDRNEKGDQSQLRLKGQKGEGRQILKVGQGKGADYREIKGWKAEFQLTEKETEKV